MNMSQKHEQYQEHIQHLLASGLFFIAYYLYYYFVINPALIYQRQEPAFISDSRFLLNFTIYPGGIADYLAVLLGQFFYYSWVGALIMTCIAVVLSVLSCGVFRSLSSGRHIGAICLLPAVIILGIYSDYKQPLSPVLAVTFSLSVYLLYTVLTLKSKALRLVLFLFLSFCVYYCTGAAVYLFVLLCAWHEWHVRRHWYWLVFFLPIVLIIQWFVMTDLFIADKRETFLALLSMKDSLWATGLLLAMYLYFIVGSPVLFMLKKKQKNAHGKLPRRQNFAFILSYLILVFAGTLLAFLRYDVKSKNLLTIEHAARHGQWRKVLDTMNQVKSYPLAVIYQANRALYHLGRLPYEMFSIPQSWNRGGLLMPQNFALSAPMQNSDIFFELGHINEAQHWAHEALTLKGPTPTILSRLALINLAKGEVEAARKYALILKKCLILNDQADFYLSLANNFKLLDENKLILSIRASMNEIDYPFYGDPTPQQLAILLDNNKHNQMAFEYLVAFYLLNGQVEESINVLSHLEEYRYPDIPRIYEEAIVFYRNAMDKTFVLKGREVSVQTMKRFKDFSQILLSYQRDKGAAQRELYQKYGNTLWYYLLYFGPQKNVSQNP